MSRKPSKPETRIEDYLDVMTGGNAALPQPILRIEFYYAFLAGMTVELPQPILDDEKLLAKICGMEVEAPTYIPGLFPRLYAYMAKKGGQDVQVPDPILRLECYWYDYTPSVQEYTGAVPVAFVADGTPLLDYIISGKTVQSGTPTPDNPIMPQGTGERTGNLFDGVIEVGGLDATTGAETGRVDRRRSGYIEIEENTNYNLSRTITATPSNLWALFYDENKDYIIGSNRGTSKTNLTVLSPANAKYLRWYVTADGSYDNLMIIVGSTAPSEYEPYGYKIPISSTDTTTPIYLGEVQTTRRVKKLVLTGQEAIDTVEVSGTNLFRVPIDYTGDKQQEAANTSMKCNAYPIATNRETCASTNNTMSTINATDDLRIVIHNDTYTTADDFKTYLAAQYAAGTPVTVWYVLATETTGIINEPLMKIGDYADTLSMEQAGVQIPTANGSTTLDVETTVKPSEIYIKYRG